MDIEAALASPDEGGADFLSMLRDSMNGLLARHADDANGITLWPALVAQGFVPVEAIADIGGWQGLVAMAEALGRIGSRAPLVEAAIRAEALGATTHGATRGTAVHFAAPGEVVLRDGRLSGTFDFLVQHPAVDDLLIFVPEGPAAVLVPLSAQGVDMAGRMMMNAPIGSRATLSGAMVEPVALSAERVADLHRLYRLGRAARALGAATAGFDLAVEHARTREQFGQVIGRFQALQHKLANSLIALEGCRLQIDGAAAARDAGSPDWAGRTSGAMAFCGPALRQVSLETHHVLGAVGYAEEHQAPHLFRLAHLDLISLGGLRQARAEIAAQLLDRGEPLVAETDNPASAYRQHLREWLAANWTDAEREDNARRPFDERNWNMIFAERMGRDGLTMLTWPKSAGGEERTPLEQLAFLEETFLAEAPIQSATVASWILGPELIAHGSPELQAQLLPGIRAGGLSFCLGYSEPNAGSDLASLRTRAVRDGDDYVINGTKIWNTDGHRASHMILAVRTDPDAAKKHAGISLFIVPMDLPGISVRPSMAFYGHYFAEVFLDEVRVPASAMLGAENKGWRVLMSALATERVIMASYSAQVQHLLGRVIGHVRETGLAADPFVRDRLAGLACEAETARLLALRAIMPRPDGSAPLVEAAVGKVFASELGERLAETAVDLIGPAALLTRGEEGAAVNGAIDQTLRQAIMMVVGGGTAEVQRNMIAQRGLELPR
ncbi:MAG: acyl-CoA dehydrogenase family protein [Novosphingobium sp.]